MTDADVDGAHIRTLMLTFSFRHLRPLIEAGNIYIAQPPLYKVTYGKNIQYAYSDVQMKEKTQPLEEKGVKYNVQRYKGLGEMNAADLGETTMRNENRILLKVSIEDAQNADDVFSILMGEKVQPRREFITANAKYANNIDV